MTLMIMLMIMMVTVMVQKVIPKIIRYDDTNNIMIIITIIITAMQIKTIMIKV